MKIIKSQHEHEHALEQIMMLMDKNPIEGSRESDEIELLALLIENYEQQHYPIDSPDPIEAIKFRMEQQGLKQKDLAPYFGGAAKVTEVLNGTRQLSINMIRRLHEGLGISANVLIRKTV
ncbi:MAG: transcriptional regulator [Methylococcales bacterium]|nr:transcriptional regulator [Methylococcales bacterium]MDD5753979.1 transcriptional regulator [Methylococcales bacterium]